MFIQACKRYRGTRLNIPTEQQFRSSVAREARFPDLVHNWGVYLNHTNTLVGYGQNQIFDNIEANYSAIKLDPRHFHNRPGYALVYRMNEYYLDNCGFQYVNDGFRLIYHQTQFQDTLINALGFEKAYTTLNVYYQPFVRMLVRLCYPWRSCWAGLTESWPPFLSRSGALDSLRPVSDHANRLYARRWFHRCRPSRHPLMHGGRISRRSHTKWPESPAARREVLEANRTRLFRTIALACPHANRAGPATVPLLLGLPKHSPHG